MEKNYLSKESVDPEIYAPPVCQVIFLLTHGIICLSGDDNGQMHNGGFLDE